MSNNPLTRMTTAMMMNTMTMIGRESRTLVSVEGFRTGWRKGSSVRHSPLSLPLPFRHSIQKRSTGSEGCMPVRRHFSMTSPFFPCPFILATLATYEIRPQHQTDPALVPQARRPKLHAKSPSATPKTKPPRATPTRTLTHATCNTGTALPASRGVA